MHERGRCLRREANGSIGLRALPYHFGGKAPARSRPPRVNELGVPTRAGGRLQRSRAIERLGFQPVRFAWDLKRPVPQPVHPTVNGQHGPMPGLVVER